MGQLAPGNLRLTNSIRSRIATAMINFKYEKGNPFQAHVDESASIAMAAYNRIFDESKRAKIASIPDGWLPKTDHIQVQFGFDTPWLYFGGNIGNFRGMSYDMANRFKIYSLKEDVKLPVPSNYERGVAMVFEHQDDLTLRYEDHKAAVLKTVHEVSTTWNMVNSTLAKFSTTNTLIKAWPECKPFVQKITGDKPAISTALSVPIADLNAKLGLPVPASKTV